MAMDTHSSSLLPLIAFQHHVGSLFIPAEEIEFVCELGVGDLAVVEHGRWRRGTSSTLPVVVKGYKPFVVGSPQDFRELLLEASKLHRLRHPNITRFLGLGCFSHGSLAEVRESMFMVEEYVGTRSLRKLIGEQMRCRLKNLYSMQTALRWAAEAASALAALHEQQPPYIHGDVKADNVFLTDGQNVEYAVAKLGDLKAHRHVYDREPSMLSQHQAHVAAKQVKQSSLARFNLERSSCSSSGSAAAWPAAGAGSSCSSLVSEAGGPHHSLWQGRMQQPTQPPQQQQPETCSSLQPQKQLQEEQQPQQQWDAVSKERAHSLSMPIGTPRSGSSSRLQGAGSCPAAWDPASTLDADATCCAVSPRSSSCSRADARGLRSSSLGSAGEVHGCDGAAGVFATSRSLPLSSCLSASELESSAAVKSSAAEAAVCSEHDAASAAAADAGEVAPGRRRNRAVNLSDSPSSTTSASNSGAHVKPGVGLVSLAAEDDEEEEQLSPSMRRLLREAAAADELGSSGDSSPHSQQEDRQHQQQLLQRQGSNSNSLLQDDSWDCSAHGSFRAVSLSYKSQSVPESMQDEQHQQQPRVQLTSAHSAPAEIGADASLRDVKVHHGKLMMPLSAPLASQGESLQQPHKQLQPQQHIAKQPQQQQPAMFSAQLSPSKREQAAAAQAGASVCYGWELSPSGAASPCGAVHSTMLDLFADMAEEEVLLCRRPRDQYTISPGSFVQHQLQPNVSASSALQLIKAAQQQQQQSWEPAFSSDSSCPAAISSNMTQPGLELTGSLRGGVPSAIESKQHGSNSAFAALTAIDCIREETSSIATDSVMGSCPASRESTAHGDLQFFRDTAGSSRDQAQGLPDLNSAAQEHNGSLYGKAASGMHGQHGLKDLLTVRVLMPLRSIGSCGGSHNNSSSSDSISDAFAAAAAAVAAEEEEQQEHDGSCKRSSSLRSNGSIAEQIAALNAAAAAAAAAADPLSPRSCLHSSKAVDSSMTGSPTAAADKAAAADVSVGGQKRVRFTVERPAGTTPSRDYSLLYAAPELLSGQRPTEKVDAFAFGVLLYELLSRGLLISHCGAAVGHNSSRRSRNGGSGSRHGGRHSPHTAAAHTPSAAVDSVHRDSDGALPQQQLLLAYAQMVAGGYRPPFPAHFPAPVTDLISSCWASEPHERPRMSDVLAQLQSFSQDRQLVYCLDSYLAGLADLGYGPGSMGPSCGCGCVIS